MAGERSTVILSWDDIDKTVAGLAERVCADGLPDVLVGVVRGGLVPAVWLSHRIGMRPMRVVEVTHTIDDSVGAAKTAAPAVTNAGTLGDLTGLDVLLVDDIAGTGDTLKHATALTRSAGARYVRTAVLTANLANWRRPQPPGDVVTYLGSTVEGWVIFPWEQTR